MQANKLTIRAKLAILAIGLGALLVLVWLNRSPSPAPTVDEALQKSQGNAPEANNNVAKLATNVGTDPFKEKLVNQQTNKSGKVIDENSTPSVPAGTDPFKEKLHLQSQQSTQVTVSPFKN